MLYAKQLSADNFKQLGVTSYSTAHMALQAGMVMLHISYMHINVSAVV
jgi:hypothetical protein